MLVAAFRSRLWCVPHSRQSHASTPKTTSGFTYPQAPHVLLDGYQCDTCTTCTKSRSYQARLYSSWRNIAPRATLDVNLAIPLLATVRQSPSLCSGPRKDRLVLTDQLCRGLVGEVAPDVGDMLVGTDGPLPQLLAVGRALPSPRERPLLVLHVLDGLSVHPVRLL